MVKQLRDSPEKLSDEIVEPTPMLEQELSLETLNAIKAIVSEEPEQASTSETTVAIVEAISAHPGFEAVKREVEPATKVVNEDMSPASQPVDGKDETGSSVEPPQDPLNSPLEQQIAPPQETAEPELSMDLIRQTVAESTIDEPVVETLRVPEEEIVRPPSVFLRLKRHIRKKLRMHVLILRMKIRDRMPTRREALRALTPRRIAIAVIIASILLKPWFLPTVFVLWAFFGSLILLAMGPDRVRHYSGLLWKRYKRKNPEKAKEISTRLMSLFEKWQGHLDRLPSRWTQGLHLPQVQSEADKYAAESAYASRMARIVQDETPKSYS